MVAGEAVGAVVEFSVFFAQDDRKSVFFLPRNWYGFDGIKALYVSLDKGGLVMVALGAPDEDTKTVEFEGVLAGGGRGPQPVVFRLVFFLSFTSPKGE